MLNFEEFCLKVSEDFMKYISASFSAENGYHAVVKDVSKNGKTFRVLLIDSPDKAIKPPVVPLDRLYDSIFLKKYNGDVVSTLKEIAASYEKNYTKAVEMAHKSAVDDNSLKIDINNVFFALMNYDANKAELDAANIPYSVEGELAITYRVLIASNENEIKSILINQNIIKAFENNGFTFEKLKEAAMENTERLFPEKLVRISEDAYLLTSEYSCFGSSAILYEHSSIKELADRSGKNVLIFPCSINTCFVLLVDEDVVREADMYKDNISQFFIDMDEPVLNTQVMMYSNKEKKLLFGDDVVIENSKSKKNVR
jgi:hypothetical protein